jgi:hypothetical protein
MVDQAAGSNVGTAALRMIKRSAFDRAVNDGRSTKL